MVDLPTVGRFVGGAGYAPLHEASLRALVAGVPTCRDLLKGDPADWKVREVGDGNLNLVFIVTSGAAGVVVKQARSEAGQIDATRPSDPTLEQSRSLLRSMFIDYARAVAVRMHGGNAGEPMGSAYRLANDVHDLLAGAQPALAARGCDPAPLLK